jgi:hypothetical protein
MVKEIERTAREGGRGCRNFKQPAELHVATSVSDKTGNRKFWHAVAPWTLVRFHR